MLIPASARDLTPKLDVNTPPAPFGGSSDYAWSPDGKELAFTAEPSSDAAWSTNTDIWTVPAEGGDAKNLTEANKGADGQPAYSPDGRWLGYVSQARPGFESDQWVLTLRDRQTGQLTQPTKALDRPVQSFAWASSAPHTIIAAVDHDGTVPIIGFQIKDDGTAEVGPGLMQFALKRGGAAPAFSISPKGGSLVFVRSRAAQPAELERAEIGTVLTGPSATAPVRLTNHNEQLAAELDLQRGRIV